MANAMIVPWEINEHTHEFFVPEYILAYAQEVLKHYDLSVKSMEIVTTKPDKGGAIWKIATNKGAKSLKLLHRRPTRSLFSLGAQEYLTEVQHARVPSIHKSKSGMNYVEAGGKLWFIADWIEPLQPVTKDLAGAKQLCYALGEFHRLSRGYIPPAHAEVASRLYNWPKSYEKMVEKMEWFRQIGNAYRDTPASKALLAVVDQFESQAIESYRRLEGSQYSNLVEQGNDYWGLVHQDYGWSNGQMGKNGMWIIDLDGVAYDLPIRDLRKLISGTMADLKYWDITWVKEMINAYHAANPITPEVYELLMIDFSLPNEFYKNIKEVVFEPELFLNEQTATLIHTIVETDKTKWPVLHELQSQWKGMKSS
ncbi:CotS family spore coat protein [Robertmurraya kyonggiensis]|uniref:CotS family spore coat protein n=1 Tax=Robertmurraya kyonggiensis TaxID=1037680 RepID=A0A4U1DAR1_9BACI|nr:CotS family spore coat protein [Robertmurraya kyonggiensis]TKC19651.1 CotS family spore coat protein [Robertmurraya kyonggiensis]